LPSSFAALRIAGEARNETLRARLTVTTPDGSVYRDRGLRSLLRDDEFDALRGRIQAEALPNLTDLVSDWKQNCPADEEPEGYFDEFRSFLTAVGEDIGEEHPATEVVTRGIRQIHDAIQELNESRRQPVDPVVDTPATHAPKTRGKLELIFDDVDE